MIKLYNMDCMEGMKDYPDKYFGLAIVDPPYGIGEDGGKFRDRKGGGHRVLEKKSWDSQAPNLEYFKELKRVCVNQVIWGANHFAGVFDSSSSGWIYWNKLMGGDFSDGELAYTSFNKALKSFTYCNKRGGAIHPTQKPIKLYEWLLKNYAKEGDKILDTHLGSGSIAIACHNMGFDLIGYEIDKEYYEGAVKRLNEHKKQMQLFVV